MKQQDLHIEENELDDLLRQLLLDGSEDEFTQNTLTMNADFIFNSPGQIVPDAKSEIALIQKLEKEFDYRKGFWKFWMNVIWVVLLITGSFFFYKFNSGNILVSGNGASLSENNSPVIVSTTDSTTVETDRSLEKESMQPNSFVFSPDTLTSDTIQSQEKVHSEKSGLSNSHIPIEKNWFDGQEPESNANTPGPTFSAKASPENFKQMVGTFNIDTSQSMGVMFRCNQPSFMAMYYKGEPFKSGMNDLQYFNFGAYAQTAQLEQAKKEMRLQTTLFPWRMPWTILEYADTNEVQVLTKSFVVHKETYHFTSIYLNKLPDEGIKLMTQPFYFRKFEVTNKEYREFTNWVRASNGFANKPISSFGVDTVPVTDSLEWGGQTFLAKGKKFRIRHFSKKLEDYQVVYNYVFFNQHSEAVKMLGKNSLYVMPDTISWVNDFTFSYNEPMTNMYFWHPAYDDYPVVGVSWYQAMAFLDWKTHFHQQQLDADGIPYEIEYTLPSDMEWELASTSLILGNNNIAFSSNSSATQDWLTSTAFSFPGHDDPYQNSNYLKSTLIKNEFYRGDYISDGYFHTGVANLKEGKSTDKSFGTKHLDPLGISWMDGNVSEWMSESYTKNWQPFFNKHLLVLDADTSESTKLAKQIELLYNKGNAANGKLVRGANWYDERFGGKPGSGRNEAGISPKRYLDPAEQHSTIGFRYVVHVKRK